jgi:hypothetical protein
MPITRFRSTAKESIATAKFDGITHYNEQRLRETGCASIGYMLEDDPICLAKIASRRLRCRNGGACRYYHDIGVHVANVGDYFDTHALVVERIHEVNAGT